MFKSNLFRRMFLLALPVLALFSVGLYASSVPLIKSTAFEIEQTAGRTILNNVFELTKRIHLNLERQRELILQAHKRQLKNIIKLAVGYGKQSISSDLARGLSKEEALDNYFNGLRNLKYGNLDYIWAANYDAFIVSHPDDQFHGKLAANITEDVEKTVIERMVDVALKDNEGYMEYNWRRLGPDQAPSRKLSYFQLIPEWQIVIGTGVYIDDVSEELDLRLKESIVELRNGLRDIKIAKTGYVYIFDSDFNMIIHPSENIERSNFKNQLDPLTGKPIGELLINVTDDQDGLVYKWDKPNDQNNYIYDKIAWVRHFEGFDWYIASSVYVDELTRSSTILGNHILTISLIGLMLSLMLMSAFIRYLVQPIHEMANVAKRVQKGDLSATSSIHRNDELGVLSQAFNKMIETMHDNISTLDSKVRSRTQALEKMNENLIMANTAQEETQKALKFSEERQRLILNAIPAYVGYFNSEKSLLFANKELQNLMGSSYDMLYEMSIDNIFPLHFFRQLQPGFNQAYEGHACQIETSGVHHDDDGSFRKNTFIPELSSRGEIQGLFFLSLDITEEKNVENRLMEAERISATGQLSGGLAHDFNNLLSIIIGNLATASEKFSSSSEVDEYIKPALKAGRRGADIANRLLAFSRKQPLAPTHINLNAHIKETIQLLGNSMPQNISLEFEEEDAECLVYADENQLENAIVNMALNAKDATPCGGVITFKAWRWDHKNNNLFDEQIPDHDFIAMSISDNGKGFDKQALEHAFEPFFSTKKDKGGNGLGLSMVFGFIKQSNGFIKIKNNEEQGATILFLLPATSEQRDQILFPDYEQAFTDHENWKGKLVLLVDDDTDVRSTVRKLVLELGFSVLEAGNGQEALEILEAVEDIYLVLSDIIMPGELDGYELANQTKQKNPDMHVLLMTGYTPDFEESGNGNQKYVVLRKPFDHKELEKALIEATFVRIEQVAQ